MWLMLMQEKAEKTIKLSGKKKKAATILLNVLTLYKPMSDFFFFQVGYFLQFAFIFYFYVKCPNGERKLIHVLLSFIFYF